MKSQQTTRLQKCNYWENSPICLIESAVMLLLKYLVMDCKWCIQFVKEHNGFVLRKKNGRHCKVGSNHSDQVLIEITCTNTGSSF